MVKAEFTTKSGMKVTLEGDASEISRVIDDFESKDKRLEERRLFLEKLREREFTKRHERNKAVHNHVPSQVKLTDVLMSFVKEGFFNEERRIGEVMARLEKDGIYPPTSTVHPLLARLVLKNKLKRNKGQDEVWKYIKSE
jgi:hypothetical protein